MWKNRILPAQRMPPHAACRRSMPELGSMSWLNGNSMLEILVFHILGLMLLDPPQEIVAKGGVVGFTKIIENLTIGDHPSIGWMERARSLE